MSDSDREQWDAGLPGFQESWDSALSSILGCDPDLTEREASTQYALLMAGLDLEAFDDESECAVPAD